MAEHLFREHSGKMTAILTRVFGLHHLEQIADVIQDTFESALQQWRFKGIPDNPEGWLLRVARYKMINLVKREARMTEINTSAFCQDEEYTLLKEFEFQSDAGRIKDNQLRLLLLCCQPQLPHKAQIMLTLNILCGFGRAEIANALLVNEETVKKTLYRAKAALKAKGKIIESPYLLQYEQGIETVQSIIYLMFNEGYKTTRNREVINHSLCYEAIRLAQLLLQKNVVLHAETNALCALMFFALARFPSRITNDGELLSIKEQDRNLWNRTFIEEGSSYLNSATQGGRLSRYHLEAIIASLHCSAQSFEQTNWKQISFLYRELEKLVPSTEISINRILAESYHKQNFAGHLKELAALHHDQPSQRSKLYYAAKAGLLERAGDLPRALEAINKASELTTSPSEKQFFLKKLTNLTKQISHESFQQRVHKVL